MSVFRYYIGVIYIVCHSKKGYWNNDRKKYVEDPMKATLYKNKKCAQNKVKELGKYHKYLCARIEEPNEYIV